VYSAPLKDRELNTALEILQAVFAFHVEQTGDIRRGFALQSPFMSFTPFLFIPEKA